MFFVVVAFSLISCMTFIQMLCYLNTFIHTHMRTQCPRYFPQLSTINHWAAYFFSFNSPFYCYDVVMVSWKNMVSLFNFISPDQSSPFGPKCLCFSLFFLFSMYNLNAEFSQIAVRFAWKNRIVKQKFIWIAEI